MIEQEPEAGPRFVTGDYKDCSVRWGLSTEASSGSLGEYLTADALPLLLKGASELNSDPVCFIAGPVFRALKNDINASRYDIFFESAEKFKEARYGVFSDFQVVGKSDGQLIFQVGMNHMVMHNDVYGSVEDVLKTFPVTADRCALVLIDGEPVLRMDSRFEDDFLNNRLVVDEAFEIGDIFPEIFNHVSEGLVPDEVGSGSILRAFTDSVPELKAIGFDKMVCGFMGEELGNSRYSWFDEIPSGLGLYQRMLVSVANFYNSNGWLGGRFVRSFPLGGEVNVVRMFRAITLDSKKSREDAFHQSIIDREYLVEKSGNNLNLSSQNVTKPASRVGVEYYLLYSMFRKNFDKGVLDKENLKVLLNLLNCCSFISYFKNPWDKKPINPISSEFGKCSLAESHLKDSYCRSGNRRNFNSTPEAYILLKFFEKENTVEWFEKCVDFFVDFYNSPFTKFPQFEEWLEILEDFDSDIPAVLLIPIVVGD